MSFVSELSRRQVLRAAAWYGGFAWLAVEVADTVFPRFGLPDWSVRYVIVAAMLGFPVALALAWSFDLSSVGLRREVSPDAAPASAAPLTPGAKLWRVPSFWFALVLGAGLMASAQQAWQRLVRPAFGDRPGLAVLPFASLSPDPANAYFADGLHEEIISTLARAGALRVISRTSVQEYRDAKRNLRDIAAALGVSLILEGSVRRDGDDLRLTLQLIDGRTDEHLWAETYDRKFRDSLHLQRAVAEQVVAAIGARLSPAQQRVIEKTAPANPDAYERYLHALALYRGNWSSKQELGAADALLSEAIALDPKFAAAYVMRARVRIWMAADDGGTPEQRASARADVERAFALQPQMPDAYAARGLYETYLARNPQRALRDLERALAMAPNDANTQTAAALTLRRLGRFDEALAHFDQAASLSPAQSELRLEHAATLMRLGRHEHADRVLRAMVVRDPDLRAPRIFLRFNHFLATGDTTGWREEYERLALLDDEPDAHAESQLMLLTATVDLPGQITLFKGLDSGVINAAMTESPKLYLAMAYLVSGQPELARPYLVAAAAAMRDEPNDAYTVVYGAMALELLGQSESAVQAADAAVQLMPEDRDAVNGPQVAILRSWVLIHSRARSKEGYAELERLVGSIDLPPRWVAVSLPWLILKDDARAQRIIREKFPNPA